MYYEPCRSPKQRKRLPAATGKATIRLNPTITCWTAHYHLTATTIIGAAHHEAAPDLDLVAETTIIIIIGADVIGRMTIMITTAEVIEEGRMMIDMAEREVVIAMTMNMIGVIT